MRVRHGIEVSVEFVLFMAPIFKKSKIISRLWLWCVKKGIIAHW